MSRVPDWRPVLLKKFMLVQNCSETFVDTTLEQSVGDAKDTNSVLTLLFHCGKRSYLFLNLETEGLSLSALSLSPYFKLCLTET